MNEYSIGIDTSNYTTSLSLVCDGLVVKNVRRLLPVAEHERGLRQSDALFYHTKALPELFSELFCDTDYTGKIKSVGVSTRPRDAEGSYMPCFLAGISSAHAIAGSLSVPLYEFSHQAGHISAAIYSSGIPKELTKEFISFHVSGGTTDIVLCKMSGADIQCTRIGGTNDLNAGQAIDRTGVMLGMHFPCGKELDELSQKSSCAFGKIKISVKGLDCSLSGLENKTKALINDGVPSEDIAAFLFEYLSCALGKLTDNLQEIYGGLPIIFAGGVMSNSRIRTNLAQKENVFFASPALSSDNACGTALLAYKKYKEQA
ncbi:MAG: peptidase M22 [Clostridia bacterium]|nr:peptidase M22 [Clostridia bacterium]